jgi:N-methylhydantoinase B
MNAPLGATLGVSALAFKGVTTPDTPANAGNYRPLKVIAPPGELMHALPPAPTFTIWSALLAPEVVVKALAQAMPDQVPAGSGGDVFDLMGFGIHPETGTSWLEATNEAVGFGAHSEGDGEDGIMHLTEPGCRNNPIEVLETKGPWLIEDYALRNDSGGHGEYRGGAGVRRTYHFLHESTALTLNKKSKSRAWGIKGGGEGANGHAIVRAGTPEEYIAGSIYESFKDGDIVINQSGGGGGWGNAFKRDPEKVRWDVLNELVSIESAKDNYGVVIDATTMTVDKQATQALRNGK